MRLRHFRIGLLPLSLVLDVMAMFQPIANLKYLKAIFLANIAGSIACIIAASFIFETWDVKNEITYWSSLQDAMNITVLLAAIGFLYCLIIVTPFVLVTYKRKRLFYILGILISVLPAASLWGSGYWDIMALCYGLVAAILFIKLYQINDI